MFYTHTHDIHIITYTQSRLVSGSTVIEWTPGVARYRSGFTINYRALFPDESRNYRVDILEASVEQNAVIWVALLQWFGSASTLDVSRCPAVLLEICWDRLMQRLGYGELLRWMVTNSSSVRRQEASKVSSWVEAIRQASLQATTANLDESCSRPCNVQRTFNELGLNFVLCWSVSVLHVGSWFLRTKLMMSLVVSLCLLNRICQLAIISYEILWEIYWINIWY